MSGLGYVAAGAFSPWSFFGPHPHPRRAPGKVSAGRPPLAILVDDIHAVKEKLLKHPKVTCEEAEIRSVPTLADMDLLVTFFRGINGERFEIMQNIKEQN